jgi:hypothetical protein
MIYDQEEKLSNEDLIKKIDGKVVEVDWLNCLDLIHATYYFNCL